MTLAVAHHQSGYCIALSRPASVTLGWTPTPGNTIIVVVYCNQLTSGVTKNTTDWTSIEDSTISTSTYGTMLARVVQIGDTSTLPAFWTVGNTFWAYDVYEISGGTGVLASDIQSYNVTNSSAGGALTQTSAAITTDRPGCLALAFAGRYNSTVTPSTSSSGWTTDEAGSNSTKYGSQFAASQLYASSGASASLAVVMGSVGTFASLFTIVLHPPVVVTGSNDVVVVSDE